MASILLKAFEVLDFSRWYRTFVSNRRLLEADLFGVYEPWSKITPHRGVV